MDFGSVLSGIIEVLHIVVGSPSTAILSFVGLVLLLLAAGLAYVAVKSKPEQITTLLKVSLFASLIGGMIFSAAGPSLALIYVSHYPTEKMSTDRALVNLENNQYAKYLVRLIAYDADADPSLGIDRLTQLGPEDQLYSFVASYDELVGYTAKEALEKLGLQYTDGHRVSAIIFPLRTKLYPANARGLLQIIHEVEQKKGSALKDRFLEGSRVFNDAELKDLQLTEVSSYRMTNFKDKYPHYCELARQFNCGPTMYSARHFVGGLYRDWHPLGFSQKSPPDDPCKISIEKYCEFVDWKKVKSDFQQSFGSRAFLIRNLEINKIPGRILIDFDKPDRQIIPDIGLRTD